MNDQSEKKDGTPDQSTNQSIQPDNVIQFPTRKKEASQASGKPASQPRRRKKVSARNTLAALLAVGLATAATNRYVFGSAGNSSLELASNSHATGRQIASVEKIEGWHRNAAWEKSLAEKLASAKVRDVASFEVGHPATIEEKLLWGSLEEKYTITFRPDVHQIDTILFQDSAADPAYILNRNEFLSEYGHLFDGQYASAKLTSVQKVGDKTIEQYTLYDKRQNATSEARFELDNYKRLISLKVQPTRI
jgi:hypothetical protein